MAGCSEYELGGGVLPGGLEAQNDGGDTGFATDTGGGADTSDSGGADTATDDTDIPTGDPCLQADHGYDVSPAARLFVDDGTPITVTFAASSSAYNDELWLELPWLQALGVGGETAPGTVYSVGSIAAGTELVFGINVRNTGDHFQSGPASRNADGVTHVAMTYAGQCRWTIGFEDLWGGGDQDYNDVELTIDGHLHIE